MIKKASQWECKPCDSKDINDAGVCLVCGSPHSKKTVKIVKRRGGQSISYYKGKK